VAPTAVGAPLPNERARGIELVDSG